MKEKNFPWRAVGDVLYFLSLVARAAYLVAVMFGWLPPFPALWGG
jgi:hypothetical protein